MRYRDKAPMASGRIKIRKSTVVAAAFCLAVAMASFPSSSALADDTVAAEGADAAPAPESQPSRTASLSPHQPKRADLRGQAASDLVARTADWVTDSRDNHAMPFVIVDKAEAKVFVFNPEGGLVGTAWALIGFAPGDDSVEGIGTMPLKAITPQMRTTPAGRFVSALGHDLGTLNVLWVDYPDAVSLHRVINTNPAERRLERIVSPRPRDHRISYGCINVPANFFDTVVDPVFKSTAGIVYILPEVKTMREVFPTYYEIDEKYPPAPPEPAG